MRCCNKNDRPAKQAQNSRLEAQTEFQAQCSRTMPTVSPRFWSLGFFLSFELCAVSFGWPAAGGAEAPAARPTFHASLKVASESAAADQSPVLLVFSAAWCGPCQALKKNVLESREFLEGGGALRVADVDIDADEKTARAFAVSAVPTLVLLTADGKIVSRRTGYLEATNLLSWVEEGRRRARAGQWEGTAPGTPLDAVAG